MPSLKKLPATYHSHSLTAPDAMKDIRDLKALAGLDHPSGAAGVGVALKKAIDVSSNNPALDPTALILWGISRLIVRIDRDRAIHERTGAAAGCEVLNYAYPWLWADGDRAQLTSDVFLDIEGTADGRVSMAAAAKAAAKLTAGRPWSIYSNAEGLRLYKAAGGVVSRSWVAAWKYALRPATMAEIAALGREHYMVQVAPGRDVRFHSYNWAGAGSVDLSVYYD